MKLKNKKTGEIGEPRIQYQAIYIDTENHMTHCYKTLRGVFEEWEEYEEFEKERNREYARKYRDNNREKYNAYHRAYRAKQKAREEGEE